MWQPEIKEFKESKNLAKEIKDLYEKKKSIIEGTKWRYQDEVARRLVGSKKGFIYYIKIYNKESCYYKIGFTRNVLNRMKSLELTGYNVEILQTVRFYNPLTAWKIEQFLHEKFKIYRINENILKKNNGNTEVYIKDILGYDKVGRNIEGNFHNDRISVRKKQERS